jgi:hypothetical protein
VWASSQTPVTAALGLVPGTAPETLLATRSESVLTTRIESDITSSNANYNQADIVSPGNSYDFHCTGNDLKIHNVQRPFNAVLLTYGSFSQDDARFSQVTRNKQCICNALVYLAMTCNKQERTVIDLDKVLLLGDQLYKSTVHNLEKTKKLRSKLLNFDEIPQIVETGEEKYEVFNMQFRMV